MTHENHELSLLGPVRDPDVHERRDPSARLRPRWAGWTRCRGDVWLVAAELADDGTDVVALLREVEAYVAESGLQAIRYRVDGRFHIMEAPPALEHAA